MIKNTCCFTGHRDLPVGNKLQKLQEEIVHNISKLAEAGFETFIAGGALGFDMLASGMVLSLIERYPQIKLKIALPYEGNSFLWRSKA